MHGLASTVELGLRIYNCGLSPRLKLGTRDRDMQRSTHSAVVINKQEPTPMPTTQFELDTKVSNVGTLLTNGNPKEKYCGGQCHLVFLFVLEFPSSFLTDKFDFN